MADPPGYHPDLIPLASPWSLEPRPCWIFIQLTVATALGLKVTHKGLKVTHMHMKITQDFTGRPKLNQESSSQDAVVILLFLFLVWHLLNQ